MRFREQVRPGTSTVFGAGWIPDKTGMCSDRDWHAYALVYLTAGHGRYADAEGRSCALAAGDLLVLFPGLRHSYGPDRPGDWTEVWLGFRGPVFAALEADGILDRSRPVLHPGLDEGLIARFDALVAAVDRGAHSGAIVAGRPGTRRAGGEPAPSHRPAATRAPPRGRLRHPAPGLPGGTRDDAGALAAAAPHRTGQAAAGRRHDTGCDRGRDRLLRPLLPRPAVPPGGRDAARPLAFGAAGDAAQ